MYNDLKDVILMKKIKKMSKKIFVAMLLFTLGTSSALSAPTKTEPIKKNTTREIKQQRTQQDKAIVSLPQEVLVKYADQLRNEHKLIIIDKSKYKLCLFQKGKEIKSYAIAVGKNPGQKQRVGDLTTPTGEFIIEEIVDASDWSHDFGDGKGEIAGAYGPWFISLATGWIGIGIHGTHDKSSIGTMASEGCIRMANEDVEELKELVSIGIKVIIMD